MSVGGTGAPAQMKFWKVGACSPVLRTCPIASAANGVAQNVHLASWSVASCVIAAGSQVSCSTTVMPMTAGMTMPYM